MAERRWVAGVDGCRAGWLVVLRPLDGDGAAQATLVERFADVIGLAQAPRVIAVDIPIGLPERASRGGRACDVAARARLGARQSSVFAVPARAAVMAEDYRTACDIAVARSDPPRRVSKQCFHLFPKMREVDALLTPALQTRVFECHPELAFWAMNGGAPMTLPKKVKSRPSAPGLTERRALLCANGYDETFFAHHRWPASRAGADDLIDAAVLAWSAARIARGEAVCLPDEPPVDARGLRMEINA